MKEIDLILGIFKTYFKENIIKSTLSIVYLFGAMLFFLYFFHINFIPVLNFSDIGYLLLIMSALGFILLISMTFMLIVPALLWSNFQKYITHIVPKEKTQNKIFLSFLSLGAVTLIGILIISTYLPNKTTFLWCFSCIIVFILCIIPFLFGITKVKDYFSFISIGAAITFMMILPFLSNLIFIEKATWIHNASYVDTLSWLVLCMGIIITIGVNLLIVSSKISKVWKGIIPLASIVFLALFVSRNAGFISSDVMRNAHLGNFVAKEMLLKSEICNLFLEAYPKHVKKLSNTNSCILKNTLVLSNIGQEVLISMGGIHHVLLKKDIFYYSWETLSTKSKAVITKDTTYGLLSETSKAPHPKR